MCVEEIMFTLIRNEICGDHSQKEWQSELTTDKYRELFILSRKHDLSPIIASALSHAAYLGYDEVSRAFNQELMRAVYRDAQRDYAFNLTNDFKKIGIKTQKIKSVLLKNCDYYTQNRKCHLT